MKLRNFILAHLMIITSYEANAGLGTRLVPPLEDKPYEKFSEILSDASKVVQVSDGSIEILSPIGAGIYLHARVSKSGDVIQSFWQDGLTGIFPFE